MSGEQRVSACREVGGDDCRVKVDAESRRAGAGGRDFRRRSNLVVDRRRRLVLNPHVSEFELNLDRQWQLVLDPQSLG
jgi:hypothetical protein